MTIPKWYPAFLLGLGFVIAALASKACGNLPEPIRREDAQSIINVRDVGTLNNYQGARLSNVEMAEARKAIRMTIEALQPERKSP